MFMATTECIAMSVIDNVIESLGTLLACRFWVTGAQKPAISSKLPGEPHAANLGNNKGIDSDSQSVISRQAALEMPGNLLQMQIHGPHPRLTDWKNPGGGVSNLGLNQPPGWFWWKLKFGNYWHQKHKV